MKGANSASSNRHYASTTKEEEQQHNPLHRYHLKLQQPPPLRASLKTTLHRPLRNISKSNSNFQTSQLK